jgi:hypothetical protein
MMGSDSFCFVFVLLLGRGTATRTKAVFMTLRRNHCANNTKRGFANILYSAEIGHFLPYSPDAGGSLFHSSPRRLAMPVAQPGR